MDDLISREEMKEEIIELIEARREWLTDASGEIRGLDAALCAAEDIQAAMRWIPCFEKLPEVGQIVLICTASKSVNEATYKGLNSQEETVWLSHGNVLWDDDVVRWMPMPQPFMED